MKNSKLYLVNNILATLVTPLAMLAWSYRLSLGIVSKEKIEFANRFDIFKELNTISTKVFIITVLFAVVTMLINNIFEEKKFKKGHIVMTVLLTLLTISLIVVSIISSMG